MKRLITNYTFNKATKKITFTDFTTLDLSRVLVVTNVASNVIIYSFADPALGGAVSGNVLTLDYDTSAMSNTDPLQIWYEDADTVQVIDRIGFAKAVSNNLDTDWGTIIGSIATGMTVNQTGGNLVIAAGTTARAETIIRSNKKYRGGLRLKAKTTLSQRIANNSFFVELVDVIGDGLAYNITSATTLVVTIPNNPFTAANVGQSMYAGNFVGTGTWLSGRYTIASVSGNDVTFTVSGFAAGTGTLSLFGWNYYHLLYDGTTATSTKFDAQRKGYASGDTTITINTTASGQVSVITAGDNMALATDQLVTSSAVARNSVRGSRDENIPDDVDLYVQIRAANGSTAPASSTTWTLGFVAVATFNPQDIVIQDIRQTSQNTPLPIDIQRSITIAVNATLQAATAAIGKTAITGMWYDATSTTLAASATFTGTGRDLLATATATAFSAAGVYGKEYRISAASDVVGDLYLEVSRDNTTFRRVKKVTAVQNAGAGQAFYAEINHVPSTRYARAVYINGAGAQTYFMLQETLIGG